jgi:hypothetical protein
MGDALNPETPEPAADNAAQPVSNDIGPFPYFIAMLSIMPGLGVILGPLAVIMGLALRKRGGKPVAVIGALGFAGQLLFFIVVIHKLFG